MALFGREADKEGICNMWTVVYMAQNKEIAENLKSVLEEVNLVRINPVNRKEKEDDYFEVSVPKPKWKKHTA